MFDTRKWLIVFVLGFAPLAAWAVEPVYTGWFSQCGD